MISLFFVWASERVGTRCYNIGRGYASVLRSQRMRFNLEVFRIDADDLKAVGLRDVVGPGFIWAHRWEKRECCRHDAFTPRLILTA